MGWERGVGRVCVGGGGGWGRWWWWDGSAIASDLSPSKTYDIGSNFVKPNFDSVSICGAYTTRQSPFERGEKLSLAPGRAVGFISHSRRTMESSSAAEAAEESPRARRAAWASSSFLSASASADGSELAVVAAVAVDTLAVAAAVAALPTPPSQPRRVNGCVSGVIGGNAMSPSPRRQARWRMPGEMVFYCFCFVSD